MLESDLELLKEIQIEHLSKYEVRYETKHPWRLHWKYTIQHSYRVERYVSQILEKEYKSFNESKKILIRAAALVHDIGKSQTRENHAIIGGEIIKVCIQNEKITFLTKDEEKELIYMISNHSNKEKRKDSNIGLNVLIDSDFLDEIGMMSLIMSTNWIDKNDPNYYALYQKRLDEMEIEYCNNGMKHLYTNMAKEILEEKLKFIRIANEQLIKEMFGIREI
jgi:putative nucleotidyltransferase with HDIG domain